LLGGFGRVSTTVVEGRRSASRTGMYCPVRASRPILFGGVLFDIVKVPFLEGERTARVNLPDTNTGSSIYIIPPKSSQYLDMFRRCSRYFSICCVYPQVIHRLPVFFLLLSFLTEMPVIFHMLRHS
jgi:hypothetical protein